MFEGYYAEQVIRDRDRERARALAMPRAERVPTLGEERTVLSTGWGSWSWGRGGAVLATAGLALVASVALPASLQGVAWGLREILELVIH